MDAQGQARAPLTAQQHGQQDGGEGRAGGSAALGHGWAGALVTLPPLPTLPSYSPHAQRPLQLPHGGARRPHFLSPSWGCRGRGGCWEERWGQDQCQAGAGSVGSPDKIRDAQLNWAVR